MKYAQELHRLLSQGLTGVVLTGSKSAKEGDVVTEFETPVPLEGTIKYQFNIYDTDLFTTMKQTASEYERAITELLIMINELSKEGAFVTRPMSVESQEQDILLPTEDGGVMYPGKVINIEDDKITIQVRERHDSKIKATVVSVFILYGIYK